MVQHSDPDWLPLAEAAQRVLADLGDRSLAVARVLRERVGAYAAIPVEELTAGISVSIAAGMAALRLRRDPSEAELAQIDGVAEARAHQAVPLAAVLQAYHEGAHAVWETLAADALDHGTSSTVLLEGAQRLWRWTDLVTVQAASAHQRAGIELVRHDQQRRTEFLHALLFGGAAPEQLREQSAAYRLSMERRYLPFQAQAGPGVDPVELQRRLAADGSLPDQPALIGLIEGSLAGILAQPPELRGVAATVALGPATELPGVPGSFLLACRALRAAVGFCLPGVHRAEDLALLTAVSSEDFVGVCLARRYLAPMVALRGAADQVEQTLHDFLASGMSVERAARAGFVHPNTVRHRLRRFEEVTGADLTRSEDLVGVWWCLQRKRLTSAEATTAAAAPGSTRWAPGGNVGAAGA